MGWVRQRKELASKLGSNKNNYKLISWDTKVPDEGRAGQSLTRTQESVVIFSSKQQEDDSSLFLLSFFFFLSHEDDEEVEQTAFFWSSIATVVATGFSSCSPAESRIVFFY